MTGYFTLLFLKVLAIWTGYFQGMDFSEEEMYEDMRPIPPSAIYVQETEEWELVEKDKNI